MGKRKASLNWGRLSLLLMNGREIDVEYTEDIYDEMWDDMMNEFGKNGIWFCSNWDIKVLEVDYLGTKLDFVDMSKVIGISC